MIQIIVNIKHNWQFIFEKYKDLSTQKYRRELTPNITIQPNKIFVRNDLFETIVKSCKATNLEFLKLKEKLGLCFYEDICDEQELISMSKKNFKEEKIITQHDVENKQLKVENENENEQSRKNKVVKDAEMKESIEKPKKIKSTNWFDKNRFKKILAIIDSKKFS